MTRAPEVNTVPTRPRHEEAGQPHWKQHGSGVYTVAVWARTGKERIVVSEYSIFHGVTPPSGYQAGP